MNRKLFLLGIIGLFMASFLGQQKLFAEDANIDSLLKDLEQNVSHKGNDPKKQLQDFKATMKTLSEQDEKYVPRMIDETHTTDKDSKYRCAIMQALSKRKSDSVAKSYIRNLKDSNPEIRACAASQLGIQDENIASEALLAALEDSDGKVRKSAAYSLGQHKNRKAVEPLKRLTKDSDKFVTITSIWSLGEIGEEMAIDRLLEICKASDSTARINAITAIGKIGGTKAVNGLKELKAGNSTLMLELINDSIKKAEGKIR